MGNGHYRIEAGLCIEMGVLPLPGTSASSRIDGSLRLPVCVADAATSTSGRGERGNLADASHRDLPDLPSTAS